MSFVLFRKQVFQLNLMTLLAATLLGCTQSASRPFKLMPSVDSEDSCFEVVEERVEKRGAPVDILWVIDNSASMKPSQTKLRKGLNQFARKYLKQGTDIQLAVITTDTFVANEAWEKYLVTPVANSTKTPKDFNPAWGPDYAKLSRSDLMKTKTTTSMSDLIDRFEQRVAVGTDGIYEEHGLGSVQQFLADNEKGASQNKLFRKGSQRIIVFLSDEDDQTISPENIGPEPRKLLYRGSYYTGKDTQAANRILPAHFTIDCPPSVIDGVTLEPMSLCMRPNVIMPVSRFKNELDGFFRELDGTANPNYFVAAIVGKDLSTIQALRREVPNEITHERGDRYIDLVNQVGNGSFAMDIGAEDYSPILDKIGLEIDRRSVVKKYIPKTTFKLVRAPDLNERMVVAILRASGETEIVSVKQYKITKNQIQITDEALITSLKPGDRIRVNYQPATVHPAGN